MGVDWSGIFGFDTPPLELFIRGSVMYIAIFILLRAVRRQMGDVGIADILVIVLVADAAQNGMAANYDSLPDGIWLVGTIFFWSVALDWASFHFRPLERLIQPGPLLLVRDGRLLWANMRRVLLTETELRSELRQQGIDDVAGVKRAQMEADGKISVIPHSESRRGAA